jgi:hypothetical protein
MLSRYCGAIVTEIDRRDTVLQESSSFRTDRCGRAVGATTMERAVGAQPVAHAQRHGAGVDPGDVSVLKATYGLSSLDVGMITFAFQMARFGPAAAGGAALPIGGRCRIRWRWEWA